MPRRCAFSGFINRDHLMRKFGLSTPQASIDLRDYQRANPGAVEYNLSAKRFEGKVNQ